MCALCVHCPVQPPPAEVLEAVEEFERAFGTISLPSGAKRVYDQILNHTATEGVGLTALCSHPSTPAEHRVRSVLYCVRCQCLCACARRVVRAFVHVPLLMASLAVCFSRRVLLQWLQDQGLVYSSVKDHFLPTLALSPGV